MNVNESTVQSLYELISECFKYNRWMDRLVSVLGVKFACPNVAKRLHKNIAHYFPQLSDSVGETCLERYNYTVEYGATPEGKEDYDSVVDMIQQMEDKIILFQNLFMGVMKIAFQNGDIQVYTELVELLKGYNNIVEQVILLNDKVGFYGDDCIMAFDHDIETFWNL